MIKKYLMFKESINNSGLVKKVSSLGKKFLLYDLGMQSTIDSLLSKHKRFKDFNEDYQDPLYLLYKTGKFPDIIQRKGEYFTKSLTGLGFVLTDDGKWHPVNKLNTNWSDISEFLVDILEKCGKYEEADKLNFNDLKSFLLDFKKNNNLGLLIDQHLIDIKSYTINNRQNTKKGDDSEKKVGDILESKGLNIKYRGGDGDVIDIIFGIDIIGEKNGKIYLVQVKSSPWVAKDSFDDSIKRPQSYYGRIDWFCAPDGDGIIIYTKDHPEGKHIKS